MLGVLLWVVGSLSLGCSDDVEDPLDATTSPAGGDLDASRRDGSARMDAGLNDGAPADDARAADAEAVVVTLPEGELAGVNQGTAHAFLAIPYAAPPVGPLRFRRPQKVAPWSGRRDATRFAARCAQVGTIAGTRSESEDCLYLNVWTPTEPQEVHSPVMVFFHGGTHAGGATSEAVPYASGALYDGRRLAEHGVVVVTVGYRLGIFGFFAHPALEAEPGAPHGNQALYDQAQALAWVRDNIARFGGDPTRVALVGAASGAEDVCLQVVSKVARGRFHAAIGQSGGCTARLPSLAEGRDRALRVASAVGCSDPATALACLRDASVPLLLAPPLPAGSPAPRFAPIVDGELLPAQPRTLFERGEAADVPYLLGANADEGTLFVPASPPVPDESTLRARLAQLYGGEQVADEILQLYPWRAFSGELDPGRAALARIACPTLDTAIRASRAGLPTWLYDFDVAGETPYVTATGGLGAGLGATHGAELLYVFGTSTRFDAKQRALSDLVQTYWSNLARSGSPNREGTPAWPSFSERTDVRVSFALETPTVLGDHHEAECAYWRAREDARFGDPREEPRFTDAP